MSKLTEINAPAFGPSGTPCTRGSKRLKFELKKIAVLAIIFGSLFAASYYVVNLLEIKPQERNYPVLSVPASDLKSNDEQLKNMLGASGASLAGFSDWAKINNLAGDDIYSGDPDGEGLANYLEYIHGTDPNNAATDGDKFSDKQEITNGYDPDAYGDVMTSVSINIDKLGVVAPMVWSKTEIESERLKELENGITHFLGSATPGQKGNAIISGHSSNYAWAKGGYNYVFKDLNDLERGDVITVNTIQKNGRIISYKYKVNDKYITTPVDEKIFESSNQPILTLSTCWPLGTNFKRVIVKAELVRS
ncbi:MAG: hypothetical protein UT03_C0010G0011 [Candidatus Moranbacteria bacterium GW2011_GWD2_38_7]|nr:MAG: hypothetical protein UT03_C0010G0011 [Candidatus Moranbacteria bacterium GW2011_GWD2_38_7]